MFRLTAVLLAGLYLTLQVGGEDRGQKRFGLIEAEQEAALLRQQIATSQSANTELDSPQTQQDQDAAVVTVAFASSAPSRPAQPLTTPEPLVQPESAVVAVNDAPAAIIDAVLAEDSAREVMYVSGRSVNVRSGPSTQDEIVGRLTRGEAVTVVSFEDNGWARVRIEGDGIDGFMSMDFLTGSLQ